MYPDQVFATVVTLRADALFVSADPFFAGRRVHLVAACGTSCNPASL